MLTLFNLDKSSISNFSGGSWRQTSFFDTTDSRPAESMTITVSEPRLPFTEPSVQLPQGSLVQIFIFPWSRTVNLMSRPDMLCPRLSHAYQPLMLCCIWVYALSTKQQRGKAWANKSHIKTACTQIRNLTTPAPPPRLGAGPKMRSLILSFVAVFLQLDLPNLERRA